MTDKPTRGRPAKPANQQTKTRTIRLTDAHFAKLKAIGMDRQSKSEGRMMFDEQPDGDPHGECAAEIERLQGLLVWAYSKLHHIDFTNMHDALQMDEIKLLLEHGI